jgi:hypothetical protein
MGVALVGCLVFSSRGLKRAIDHASQGSTTGFFLATIFFFGVIGIPLFASLVFVSFGQYPLHLYMAIKIRTANENSLLGDSENSWGFGQIVPLILLIPIIRDIGKAYIGMSQTCRRRYIE